MFDAVYWFVRILGKFFTIGPRLRREGDKVVASSNWVSQVLCLGFAGRTVVIDPGVKIVRIRYRRFWFVTTSRRIQFDWVDKVLYGYQDIGTGVGAYDEGDLFKVELGLHNGQFVTLFRFIGEGSYVNNGVWPDWMYWPDFKIAEWTHGAQEHESLAYAETVSHLIGLPLENPMP